MAQISYGTITITDTNDVESIVVEYNRNQSTTTPPAQTDPDWSTKRPTWAQDYYIWQRTRIHKSGTQASEDILGNAVCLTGSTGQSLSSTKTQYTNVASNVTITTANHGNYTWTDNVPTYNSSKPVYWARVTNIYANPAKTEYLVYKDNGITDAVKTSNDANTTANSAKSKADTVEGNLNNYIASNDSALSALQTKTKYFWTNLVAHTKGSGGWTKPNYPVGTYAASGISGTNFDAENSSTYGYNTLYSNGIKLRYNAINLGELTGSSLIFYRPSTTTQGTKGMELSSSSLNFYDSTGSVAQATFGGTQATISGTINAYDGKIGKGAVAWTIGNDSSSGKAMIYTGTRGSADSAYLSTGVGTESIGGSGTLNTTNDGYWTITAGANFGVTTKGKVYASSGKIGGWNLESNRLSIGTWGSDNSAMLCSGSSGAKSIGGSPSTISDWVFTAGSNFGVTKSGDLYCGNLNATGGSFTGALTATSLTIAPGATFDGDIDQFKGTSFGWNLVRGTKTLIKGNGYWNTATWRTSDSGGTVAFNQDITDSPVPSVNKGVTVTFTTTGTSVGICQDRCPIQKKQITQSVWVKGSVGDRVTLQPIYSSTSGETESGIKAFILADSNWTRLEYSKTPNYAHESVSLCYIYAQAATVGNVITICAPKLEYGSPASEWCTAEDEVHGEIGADSGNMLLDVYAPSVAKINAKYDRYFSESGNSSTVCSFVPAGDEKLPDPNAKYFVRIENTETGKTRGFCFYNCPNKENAIGLVVGETYRVSCWVRQLTGSSNFNIYIGGDGGGTGETDTVFVPTSKWQKFERIFTFNDRSKTSDVWGRLYFYNKAGNDIAGAGTGIGAIDMCGFKLERINAITASGRNVCLRTADYNGWGKDSNVTFDGNVMTLSKTTTKKWRNAWQTVNLPYSVVRNQKITITYKIKAASGQIPCVVFSLGIANGETATRLKYRNRYTYTIANGEWQTVAISAYITDKIFGSTAKSGTPDYDNGYFHILVGTPDTYLEAIQIKEIMVALGSDPCAWSPAPEDSTAYTDESIDAIEIGARNLLLGSNNLRSFATESTTNTTITRNSTSCTVVNKASNTSSYGIYYDIAVESGADYVLSATLSNCSGVCHWAIGDRTSGTSKSAWTGIFGYVDLTNGLNVRKFKIPTTCTVIRIYISVQNNGSKFTISNIQLEKGNKATQWAPAPEDTTQYFWADDAGVHVTNTPNGPSSGYNSLLTSREFLFRLNQLILMQLTGTDIRFYQNGNERAIFGSNVELKNGNKLMQLTVDALRFLINNDERVSFGEEVAMKSAIASVDDGDGWGSHYSQNFMNIKPGGLQLKQVISGTGDEYFDGTHTANITPMGIKPDTTTHGLVPNAASFILHDGVYGPNQTRLWYTGDDVEDGYLSTTDYDGETGSVFVAGWVTGSGKQLMFTIPLSAPIAEGWTIDKGTSYADSTISLLVTVRQNNHYLLGSGSAGVEIPRNATEWENLEVYTTPSGISVHYYSTTAFSNVINNDACGIQVGYTFKLVKDSSSSDEEMM